MNKSQFTKFLTDLGYNKDKATTLAAGIPDSATAAQDADIEEALTSCVNHQLDLYKNSQEYKDAQKSIKDKALAEVHSKAEKKIIAIAGLTPEEVKDKKYDEIVDLAWKKASKMGDKTSQEIQDELNKKDAELKRIQEEEIPKIRAEVDAEKLTFRMDTGLIKELGGMSLIDGVDHDDAMILIKTKAAKKGYKIVTDDKGVISFTMEDGGKINTADKKGFLGTKDILNEFLAPMIKKSNGKPDPDKTKIKTDDDDDHQKVKGKGDMNKPLNSAMAKAQAHAEKMANLSDED